MSQPPENLEPQQPDANSTQQADSSAPQNVVQGNQNRVVQGNENQSVLGDNNTVVQGNNNLMLVIKELILGQQLAPVGNPAREHNQRLLLADVKQEVTARLRQSLHNTVLINLGKESQPQQVKRPWDAEIKIGLKPAVPLPETTTILEVFDSQEIAGKLLILGVPGSGKTTTQLELAQELIKKAEEQPDYPVPVLFNLSSWRDDRQSITEWLVAELKSKYGVSKKLGQEWVNNHQLLPLLDGLDELKPQRQELCVHAINQFFTGESKPRYLVVCSRSEEYSNYSTQLQLNGAIYLQPLTNNQICDYLTSINYIELWSTISSDLNLLDLVKTPLLLSITVLASQEISVDEWQHLTSTTNRLQYLLDAYLGRMLTRDINSRAYFKNKTPNAKQTRMWLVWLAKQMQRESQTEFLIEEMQPNLLISKSQKINYRLILGLFFGVLIGLSGGLMGYLIYGLNWGVIFGLVFGLMEGVKVGTNGSINGRLIIKIIEKFIVSKKNEFSIGRIAVLMGLFFCLMGGLMGGLILGLDMGLMERLILGLVFGLMGGLFGLICGLFFGLSLRQNERQDLENIELKEKIIFRYKNEYLILGLLSGLLLGLILALILEQMDGLIGGLMFGLIPGLIAGLIGVQPDVAIENKKSANQGIWKSAINSVFLGLMGVLIVGLIFALNAGTMGLIRLLIALNFWIIGGIGIIAVSVGMYCGGEACIQHFTLRLILYFNGYIPWNYARFLDYCTERLFLQRVGGRYRFIHKLLQDHFAKMEFRRN